MPHTLSLGRHEGLSGIDAVFGGLSDPLFMPVALGAERVHNIALTRQFHRLLKLWSMCHFGTRAVPGQENW